ncbi:MAG: hypothetical protein JXR86_14005 [Spirochaetales bacterium]|nr:hypothetical protein [Spirochaetales bacterium]
MKENKTKGFSLEAFVPSWPSSVMGTGIIPVALYLGQKTVPFFYSLSIFFTALTFLLLTIVFGLWIARLFKHPKQFYLELHHPVAGSFLPTMPIAFMIAAIDLLLTGPGFMESSRAVFIVWIMFLGGTAGIYLFSWLIMPVLFQSDKVKAGHGTFGWYIPPVSHLIVPVLGLELIHMGGEQVPVMFIFFISLISLGIGLFLFIFVGANVFHRYLYHSTPVGKMAPTLFIGQAPTAVLVIILVKLNSALHHIGLIETENFSATAQILGIILWGFTLWWMVLSIAKTVFALMRKTMGFTLSWWAFTFPIGAVAVSTGSLNTLFHMGTLNYIQIGMSSFLLLVWLAVSVFTVRGISNGSIFAEED